MREPDWTSRTEALRVAAIPRRGRRSATRLLFESYRHDPAFAALYGSPPEPELDGTLPTFEWILRSASLVPRTTLGCYRDDRLVGVVTYVPDAKVPGRDPLRSASGRGPAALGRVLQIYWSLRYQPSLGPDAAARWHAYDQLGRMQNPTRPALRIMALGVVPESRGTGVARRLLAAVEADLRWRPQIDCLQVETWDETKVRIYERLGFETVAHGTREGVECWTMLRSFPPGGPPASPAAPR